MHVFAGRPERGKAIIAGFLGVPLVSSTDVSRLDDLSDDKRGQEGANSLMPFSLTASQSATDQSPRQAYTTSLPAIHSACQPASQGCDRYIIYSHSACQPACSGDKSACQSPAASLSACQQATQPHNHAAILPWSQSVSQQSVYKHSPISLPSYLSHTACHSASISVYISASQPANQPTSQPARQPASQTASQPASQPARQPDSQSASHACSYQPESI